MHSQFTAGPSSNGMAERDCTVGDVPGVLWSPASGADHAPLIFDVIIAGCGPTGAMLAAELRLHGVRVLVLEKETEPVPFVRANGLHIRSIELMAMRGLLDRFLERGRPRPAGGIFAAITKPAPEGLDSAHGRRLDRHGAARIVRRVTRRAQISKQVSPHALRHAFITAALDAGSRCGTCRKQPHTPTRAPPCDTAGQEPGWTGTPPISWPHSSPELRGSRLC